MLDWTGERYLPWIDDAAIAYEHLHRYFYAAQFVKGKRVLDLASGEGYGANRLASAAHRVTGVDIDLSTVRHATAKYHSANLQYVVGSISEIPLAANSFDVVTCFEAIEHIEEQDILLREVKRVLAPEGIFLVSTPNKSEYQHDGDENPFHVKELSPEEFEQALRKQFRNIQFLGQRIYPQSSLWRLDASFDGPIRESLIRRTTSEFDTATAVDRVPVYILAVASNGPLPNLDASVLVDVSDQLIRQKDVIIAGLLAGKSSDEEARRWLHQQVKEGQESIEGLEKARDWLTGQIEELKKSIDGLNAAIDWQKGMIQERDAAIQQRDEALEWRARHVNDLEKVIESLKQAIESLKQTNFELNYNLETITHSTGWRWVLRLSAYRDRLLPKGSRRRELFSRLFARS